MRARLAINGLSKYHNNYIYRGVFRILSNIYDGVFYENGERILDACWVWKGNPVPLSALKQPVQKITLNIWGKLKLGDGSDKER